MDSALVFDWIEISGLMSFPPNKPQRLILDTHRLTTVVGENLDVGDGERNGVGKTALIDAILYLYFGKSPRVSNQEMLNYIEPGPIFVTGCARRGPTAFLVERGDHPSILRLFEKPADDPRDFRTREGGKPIFETTKSSKPETTKRIIEILGFDLKLADVLLVATTADKSCFFLKTEEEQRSIVERIFGFTMFTEKADLVRELRKDEQKNLNTKESALIATKQANDRILFEITRLEENSTNWAALRDKTVKFLVQQISSYKEIDFDHEIDVLSRYEQMINELSKVEQEQKTHNASYEALKQKHAEWDEYNRQSLDKLSDAISTYENIDTGVQIEIIKRRIKIEDDIETVMAELEAIQREREPSRQTLEANHINKSRLLKQIDVTEHQIIQLNEYKCPTCGQDWADTKEHILKCIDDLDAQNAEGEKLDAAIQELKAKVKHLDTRADKMRMTISGFSDQLGALPKIAFTSIEDATRAYTSLDEQRQRLNEARTEQNPHTDLLDDLAAKIAACEARRQAIRHDIAAAPKAHYAALAQGTAAKQEYEALKAQFAETQQQQNPYLETIDNLRNNALKSVDETEIKELRHRIEHMTLLISLLADRDSPVRKAVLHEWLPELNIRVNQYLEFLELPHRVTFDSNMTASFTVSGARTGFSGMSTGQRLRVWIATNRAFREIFELINYDINLFWIDELLDKGMSARGADMSYRLLEQMVDQGRSVFLISHRQELVDRAEQSIIIQLENGLSTIIH